MRHERGFLRSDKNPSRLCTQEATKDEKRRKRLVYKEKWELRQPYTEMPKKLQILAENLRIDFVVSWIEYSTLGEKNK